MQRDLPAIAMPGERVPASVNAEPGRATHLRRANPRQRTVPYVDALRAYAGLDPTRLNVPGHKGGSGAAPALTDLLGDACFAVDVPPLLWGVDRGDRPMPLDEALNLAADLWGARRTWFLTNGASQGNQATCLALRALGERVLVQRSVHSSVVDGLVLSGARPVFIAPTIDTRFGVAHGLTPSAVHDALQAHPDCVAVYVVSPSYFGAVADVEGLANAAHGAGVPLIVDEAWGSHFGFHPALPVGALTQGADVVISSTHKMIGSLTQSAMLHLGHGPFAEQLDPLLDRAMTTFQSTSTSSLLLASLDAARHHMATRARNVLDRTLGAAAGIRDGIGAFGHVSLADDWFLGYDDVVAVDPLRIAVDVAGTGLTGDDTAARLRLDHAIDVEVANRRAIVAVVGAAEDPASSVATLIGALGALPQAIPVVTDDGLPSPPWGEPILSPREAALARATTVAAADAVGRVSSDSLSAYPPGIPNVVPGERITDATLAFLRATVERGGFVRGAVTPDVSRLRVVDYPAA